MPRRITNIILAPILACAAAAPALAHASGAGHTHVIAQKSAKKGQETVYLSRRLSSGHRYRIEIVSSGKYSIAGNGFENYTYLTHSHPVQGMKPFSIKSKTPYRSNVRPPIPTKIAEWILTVQVQITGTHPLTVRYLDLGKFK